MARQLRLALLICDDLIPPLRAVHRDYSPIFSRLLADALARTAADAAFTLDSYDVVHAMAYPPDDLHYDALLISGSKASAYHDLEWINRLVAYVRHIILDKPNMKLFGICFGHQIVARALGGVCVPNSGHWEVAVTTVQLTSLGKAIFGADQLDIQQMHRDHVPLSPPVPGAHLLGSTDVAPNQGMVLFSDPAPREPPVDLTSIHVLTLQGHPEFTEPIVSALIDARVGLLGEDLAQDARTRAGGISERRHHHPDGLPCDGVGRVGKAIWGILGVV